MIMITITTTIENLITIVLNGCNH